MLAIEREIFLYQASKIRFIKLTKDKIDKNTNVTAYYLVVGEIFNNLESFLNICGNSPYVRDHKACLEYLISWIYQRKKSIKR